MSRQYTITINDESVIALLDNLPDTERDRIIERYILLGDTVMNYASVTTSEASFQRFFEPTVNKLQSLHGDLKQTRDQLETSIPTTLNAQTGQLVGKMEEQLKNLATQFNSSRQQLEQNIPNSIQASFSKTLTEIQSTTQSLRDLHTQYDGLLKNQIENLSRVVPALSKSQSRGAIAQDVILDALANEFRDDEFESVAKSPHTSDILGMPNGSMNAILIEVKDYTNEVPSKEVEKLWRDMESQNARIGCFISMQTRIAKVASEFAIVADGNRLGVFVVSEALNYRGHTFAYTVARKLQSILSKTLVPTSPSPDLVKYDLIARILSNQLNTIKSEMQNLDAVQSELNDAKLKVVKSLDAATQKLGNMRIAVDGTIEAAFRDFSAELNN